MGAPARARGFTLLELLVVIAIVAIIAGTLSMGVARATPERRVSTAMDELTTELSVARVEAMQRGRIESVECGPVTAGLRMTRGERIREWKTPAVVLYAAQGVTARFHEPEAQGNTGVLRAEFDTMGRTKARRWEVWIDGAPGRIWAIAFDPVSGAPRLEKPGIAAVPSR